MERRRKRGRQDKGDGRERCKGQEKARKVRKEQKRQKSGVARGPCAAGPRRREGSGEPAQEAALPKAPGWPER